MERSEIRGAVPACRTAHAGYEGRATNGKATKGKADETQPSSADSVRRAPREPSARVRRPKAMTADATIVKAAKIALVLGWPAIGLLFLSAGYGPVVEWSMPVLIGVTIGLAMRWMTDRAG